MDAVPRIFYKIIAYCIEVLFIFGNVLRCTEDTAVALPFIGDFIVDRLWAGTDPVI